MCKDNVKTIPLFPAHSDKTDGKLRIYGAVEQHEFNGRRLLIYTLDETEKRKKGRPEPVTVNRVIVIGWLTGKPRPQAKDQPTRADIALISPQDYEEVARFVQKLYSDRTITIWK